LGDDGPPGGTDEVDRVVADRLVTVVGRDRDERDVLVPHLVERRADEVEVLPEAAGAVGGGHEEGDVLASLVLDDAQEVADADPLRIALLARGHAAAELEGALVRVGRRPSLHADRADRARQEVAAAVRHVRQIETTAFEPLLAQDLLDLGVHDLGAVSGSQAAPPRRPRAPPAGRPATTSAESPCCRGTPRSASSPRRRSGARRTAGSSTACPRRHGRSA